MEIFVTLAVGLKHVNYTKSITDNLSQHSYSIAKETLSEDKPL